MTADIRSQRTTDPDGAAVDIFPLPTDETSLEQLLRDLFENHWQAITFGPLIQGAAWEMRAPHAPSYVGMLDGYLTVAFGASHFHVCIGPTRGPRHDPTPPALARHRQTARAELYRRLDRSGAPGIVGLAAVQRQGRAAAHHPVAEPVPFCRGRQARAGTGLVAVGPVGSIARTMDRIDRIRSARPVRGAVHTLTSEKKGYLKRKGIKMVRSAGVVTHQSWFFPVVLVVISAVSSWEFACITPFVAFAVATGYALSA